MKYLLVNVIFLVGSLNAINFVSFPLQQIVAIRTALLIPIVRWTTFTRFKNPESVWGTRLTCYGPEKISSPWILFFKHAVTKSIHTDWKKSWAADKIVNIDMHSEKCIAVILISSNISNASRKLKLYKQQNIKFHLFMEFSFNLANWLSAL